MKIIVGVLTVTAYAGFAYFFYDVVALIDAATEFLKARTQQIKRGE